MNEVQRRILALKTSMKILGLGVTLFVSTLARAGFSGPGNAAEYVVHRDQLISHTNLPAGFRVKLQFRDSESPPSLGLEEGGRSMADLTYTEVPLVGGQCPRVLIYTLDQQGKESYAVEPRSVYKNGSCTADFDASGTVVTRVSDGKVSPYPVTLWTKIGKIKKTYRLKVLEGETIHVFQFVPAEALSN